jgi:hypothetical protein
MKTTPALPEATVCEYCPVAGVRGRYCFFSRTAVSALSACAATEALINIVFNPSHYAETRVCVRGWSFSVRLTAGLPPTFRVLMPLVEYGSDLFRRLLRANHPKSLPVDQVEEHEMKKRKHYIIISRDCPGELTMTCVFGDRSWERACDERDKGTR